MKGTIYHTANTGHWAGLVFRLLALFLILLSPLLPASPARAEGETEWIRRQATTEPSLADNWSIKPAYGPDGSLYVFGSSDGSLQDQEPYGFYDLFLHKFTTDGTEVWSRQFGAADYDFAEGIAVDATGVYLTASGGHDISVYKYDLDGTFLWSQQFGSAGVDYGKGIAVTGSGVFVTGWGYGTFDGSPYTGGPFSALRKYDRSSGDPLWTVSIGPGEAVGIATDGTDVYVAGGLGEDGFLNRYTPEGTPVWTRSFNTGRVAMNEIEGVAYYGSRVFVTLATILSPSENPSPSWDGFIKAFNADGSEAWQEQFGTDWMEWPSAIHADSTGVYVSGLTNGVMAGLPAGLFDPFIRRYDLDGTNSSTVQFGTPGDDETFGLASDSAGIVVTGTAAGSLDGQPSRGGPDVYLKKLSPDLNPLWTVQFTHDLNMPNHDYSRALNARGAVVLAGNTLLNGVNTGSYSSPLNFYVSKYSSDGTQLWTKASSSQNGTASMADIAWGTVQDQAGNVFLTGQVSGMLEGQANLGLVDAFLQKYDPDGNLLWTHQFGSNLIDTGRAVAVDATGIFLAGTTGGLIGNTSYGGATDIFVQKYSTDGDLLWTDQFGSEDVETLEAISLNSSGLYVGGYTKGTLAAQTSAGGYDAFIRKYDLVAGAAEWTHQFGTGTTDMITGLAASEEGVVVSGSTLGSLDGQANTGTVDAFVRMYNSDGIEQWTRQSGAAVSDSGEDVAIGEGGIYTLNTILTNGYHTTSVRKYSLGGGELWTVEIDPNDIAAGVSIAVDENGLYLTGQSNSLDTYYSTDAVLVKLSLEENNQAPVVGPISASLDPVAVNTNLSVSASFTDADPADTHAGEWSWGDGTISAGIVAESSGSGTVSGSHTYTTPGVYAVSLTVTDPEGQTGTATHQYIVVYDPSGGFVTGAGWISSPAGAYAADPTLEGKATFGFVSRYLKGATIPSGHTEFHFNVANLSFKSTTYEWLVAAGARAQFKGSGTLDGQGDYGFMLTAVDGDLKIDGSPDTFRIKIWDKATDTVIYDNQMGAADDAEPGTTLGGGSIKIQK